MKRKDPPAVSAAGEPALKQGKKASPAKVGVGQQIRLQCAYIGLD